jgi:type VI secretion system protein ImpH
MKKEALVNNEIFTDFKAVAKAADLIERGIIAQELIEVVPVGSDRRAFTKDIKQSFTYFSDKRRQDRIRIETNREGLYDMLPEGLFHQPPKGSTSMDEESMIQDVRARREEEKHARLFFSPFDVELNHIRVMTELYENRLDKRTTYTDLNQVFGFGWEEFSLLNKEQSIIWMHLLPEIHQKRNDIVFISSVLSALFNLPISLTDTSKIIKPMPISNDLQVSLGNSALGVNTIIGNEFLPDNDQLTVQIGPSNPARLLDFMPGNDNRKILDMALDYLIPIDTEVTVDITLADNFKETSLVENSPTVYLGYTVYL